MEELGFQGLAAMPAARWLPYSTCQCCTWRSKSQDEAAHCSRSWAALWLCIYTWPVHRGDIHTYTHTLVMLQGKRRMHKRMWQASEWFALISTCPVQIDVINMINHKNEGISEPVVLLLVLLTYISIGELYSRFLSGVYRLILCRFKEPTEENLRATVAETYASSSRSETTSCLGPVVE